MSPPHIAVVDDERDITRLLATYLPRHGFRVTEVHSGQALLALMRADPPALVLLDLGLGDEDGLGLARRVKEESTCGLIILTGRSDSIDKILGLEIGADDYVTKPFELRELVARIKAVLRRTGPSEGPDRDAGVQTTRLQVGDWIVDVDAREVRDAGGRAIALTSGEFDLLVVFARHRGRVLSRDFLLGATRGRDGSPLDRTIDVQVGRLRRKLEDDAANPKLIKSVRGAGYVLAVSDDRA